MSKNMTRVAFLLLMTGGEVLIGVLTAPDDWFANLNKPSFNPPSWIFGPVWSTLSVLIAIAGWRTWEADQLSPQMQLWWGSIFCGIRPSL